MIKKLERFTRRIDELTKSKMDIIISQSLEENKEIGEDLITSQLSEGIKGDGESLHEYRSDEYASFKASIGSKSSPVADLKLTGNFHRSITLKTTKNTASFISDDEKDEKLSLKYGEEIKQFTEESKGEMRGQIKPSMQERINKFIFTK